MPQFAVGQIQPNPFRHIDRYPIRADKVAALRESIRTTDFWDNVVGRVVNGKPEIAYGHHRLAALKAEYGPRETVNLIIRKLSDEQMLQIMARENMEEWGTSAAVEHETVRAVVDAYADGLIELEPVDSMARDVRNAPNFVSVADGGHPYTATSVARFLGWVSPNGRPQDKVGDALAALQFIEEGILKERDFEGLTTKQAQAVVSEARKVHAERERVARAHKQEAERADREAVAARKRQEQAERERHEREAEMKAAETQAKKLRAQREAREAAAKEVAARKEAEMAERRKKAAETAEAKQRETGRKQATKVGEAVSADIRSGGGYRDAAKVAASVRGKKEGPPSKFDPFVQRLITDLGKVLDDRDPRHDRIEAALKHIEHPDLAPRTRENLARTFEVIAQRADKYAARVRKGKKQITQPKRALTTGRR